MPSVAAAIKIRTNQLTDMEVAGQWRREWAGTAEYGKVTEGGVTKRVARAMEVLHASTPGARVRVLRAAYHTTTGPGVPASSYMLQSSRRVISSGYDFLEPTSSSPKPLEISSMPLEMSDTNIENSNYKVTEPDDLDISEPSKWRSATGRNSIRLPSEESSSTDNARIIDLDSKSHRNSFKKQEFENSHKSEKSPNLKQKRVSPLLDAPVTLSTLKYKSLLSGNDEWNNRRNSYSFEDTVPLNKIILDRNDRFAIESSTDSGICKSSEVVNDIDSIRYQKLKESNSKGKEETFKDWLYKNRINTVVHHPMKPLKEHSLTPERQSENNITLQSSGKMCITLPVTVETEDAHEHRKSQICDEDRKSKKVEFCKTELHFTVDTGTVNIIATDEKPPPTNDFRRRRSAFVPINDRFEKSVTLFGEKIDLQKGSKAEIYLNHGTNEIGDYDENTAATKSILKNKIPKPKPYLLGENMTLGNDDNFINKTKNIGNDHSSTGVSIINAQLDRKHDSDTKSDYFTKYSSSACSYRTTNQGSIRKDSFKNSHKTPDVEKNHKLISHNEIVDNDLTSSVKRKLKILQTSPILGTSNSRELRDSDLTYFGIEENQKLISKQRQHPHVKLYDQNKEQEEIFESVRLVQKVSSSVCSSEIESDEAPEYQNISSKTNHTPIPAPRLRIKYGGSQTQSKKSENLISIKEQENEGNISSQIRQTRSRRQDTSSFLSRSISEPPKINRTRYKEHESNNSKKSTVLRLDNNGTYEDRDLEEELDNNSLSENSTSLYVNLKERGTKMSDNGCSKFGSELNTKPEIKERSIHVKENSTKRNKAQKNSFHNETSSKKSLRRSESQNSNRNDKLQSCGKIRTQRTEKLVTPELSHTGNRRIKDEMLCDTNKEKDRYIRSSCRYKTPDTISTLKEDPKISKAIRHKGRDSEEKYIMKNNKHSLINNTHLSNVSPKTHPDLVLKKSSKLKESKGTEKKYHDSKKSRRSEYVINYDDKNGAVSSVRKIKPLRTMSNNKKNSNRENKENSNEQNTSGKQLNKIALQKYPDQQRDQYGMGYIETASKSKKYVQRACQVL